MPTENDELRLLRTKLALLGLRTWSTLGRYWMVIAEDGSESVKTLQDLAWRDRVIDYDTELEAARGWFIANRRYMEKEHGEENTITPASRIDE